MIEGPLVTSGPLVGRRALDPIADQIIGELLAFGALAPERGLTEQHLARFAPRAQVGIAILRALEATTALRFRPVPLPYLANTAHWRPEVPVGGHLDDPDGPLPLPSEVAASLLGGFKACTGVGYPAMRPLRAVLAVEGRSGFGPGITMLTQLYTSGFVPPFSAVRKVLDVVLADPDRGTGDRLARLVRGYDPAWSSTEWLAADLSLLHRRDRQGRGAATALGVVLPLALEEIRRLRRAGSWDEWVVRSSRTRRISLLVYDLAARAVAGGQTLAPPVAAVASQIEEIGADCGSFGAMWSGKVQEGHLRSDPLLLTWFGYGELVTEMAGTDRIRRERVFLDDVLRAQGHEAGEDAMATDAWGAHSWRLAPVAADIAECPVPAASASADPAAPDFGDVRGLAVRIQDLQGHPALVDELQQLLEEHPWSPFVRWELAVALDEGDRHDEALQQMIAVLGLAGTRSGPWISLGVILGHLGARAEGAVAQALDQLVADATAPPG